jgi:integrase
MKNANPHLIHPKHLRNATARRRASTQDSAGTSGPPPAASTIRTTPRDFVNPVDYRHPYDSMGRFAKALALRYDANRTRHAYYRQLRLIHEHFALDPALLTEAQLRDYFLFVKLEKHWKPKSIRQALAAARQFFVDLLGHADWTVFGQIRTKDHDVLPAVLTRRQVHDLLAHIRLRRYRTPIKLIYACGLRLSECLALTIHDIKGSENKLFIRNSKGHQDRVLPLPTSPVRGTPPLLGLSPASPPALPQRRPWRQQPASSGHAHASGHRAHALFVLAALAHPRPQGTQLPPPPRSTRFATASRPTCWKPAPICTPSRSSSVTSRSPPPWCICI